VLDFGRTKDFWPQNIIMSKTEHNGARNWHDQTGTGHMSPIFINILRLYSDKILRR